MWTKSFYTLLVASLMVLIGCNQSAAEDQSNSDKQYEVQKSEAEWKQELTEEEYYVLREAGTEPAFKNEYWDNKKEGVYHCAGCKQALFSSETKFKSGTGWPSFWKPINGDAVDEVEDRSGGMVRTEIVCSRCGSHIGHVFNDGPEPTGLRYCMNSVAMDFEEKDQ